MFRFENPEYFYWLILVPLALLVWFAGAWLRRRSLGKLGTERAAGRLLAEFSPLRNNLAKGLTILGFVLLIVALANPQWGMRRETVTAQSSDIFIALDISTSMLAEDIPPNRLERSKRFARNLIERFKGDRIGLILFAGNAYLQMPLTLDYAAAELFLRSAHPGLAATQGTAVAAAIELAMGSYEDDVAHQKAFVLITDGENHEEGAIEAMERGSKAGLIPFIVSVGTEEGAFIPVSVRGRQDYKRDENGNPVRSRVNEDFLGELADAGDGVLYSILGDDAVIDDIENRVADLSKREMEQRAFTDFRSYFQYFLLGAIAIFCLALFIGNRKTNAI